MYSGFFMPASCQILLIIANLKINIDFLKTGTLKMPSETYYEILEVNENASQEIIELAYQRLLREAKDRLQDSPMYRKREQRLTDAYRVLSSLSLRNAYNNKLARERSSGARASMETTGSFDWPGFISGFIFSRTFIGAVVFAVILITLLPSGRDIMTANMMSDYMQYEKEIRQQNLAFERERMASMNNIRTEVFSNQRANTDYYQKQKELAEQRRLEREARYQEQQELNEYRRAQYRERQLALQQEREEKRLARKKEYEKRNENYRKLREQRIAEQRSQEFIEQTERATRAQQELNTLKANEY